MRAKAVLMRRNMDDPWLIVEIPYPPPSSYLIPMIKAVDLSQSSRKPTPIYSDMKATEFLFQKDLTCRSITWENRDRVLKPAFVYIEKEPDV